MELLTRFAHQAALAEFEPHLRRGMVELPNDPLVLAEFRRLEKRAERSGRIRIEHPRGGTAELVTAAAHAVMIARGRRNVGLIIVGGHRLSAADDPVEYPCGR